ncbi:predicted protein [Uncinocarpus reesii 1704]|uniref:RING-type E3 ubiquitin transferase n=1 Tax=Uncinocarpus reesii (strain UAMH 1704) TaxID=336963 RepID=C4JSA4_UNCRE|nr:uncharacterized protein UREG_05343 [Uncinocarpus reesii 1704]EEP80501.1 predicted protein [Uncinocarpus reesii 1704]
MDDPPENRRGRMIYILLSVLFFALLLLGLVFFYVMLKYRERNHQRRLRELQQQGGGENRDGLGLRPLPRAAVPGQPGSAAKVMKIEEVNDRFPETEYGLVKRNMPTRPEKVGDGVPEMPPEPGKDDAAPITDTQPGMAHESSRDTHMEPGLLENQVESHTNLFDYCAICLDVLKDDSIVRNLTCHHIFHSTCIDPWLTGRTARCPICKTDMA